MFLRQLSEDDITLEQEHHIMVDTPKNPTPPTPKAPVPPSTVPTREPADTPAKPARTESTTGE